VSCQARLDAPGTLHHTKLRGLKNPGQGSVKYPGDPAEETEARLYAGLSTTNPAHLLLLDLNSSSFEELYQGVMV
jgi:hypothetical protein